MQQDAKSYAMRISVVGVIVNVFLAAGKLLAGIIGHSAAMISDGVHSASDLVATFMVIIGIKISSNEADRNHPYGHERLESVMAVLLGMILLLTGGLIGWSALDKIIHYKTAVIDVPGILPLIAAIVSIVAKEALYRYTIHGARVLNSEMLKADAWHHRSDALSSVGSLIGITGARLGFPLLDPLASVVICVMILKVALDIMRGGFDQMTDRAIDEETCDQIRELALAQPGVICVDELRTRSFSSKFYVDMEIAVDGELSLYAAHDIAERVHLAVEEAFPLAKHCMVHVNPYQQEHSPEKEQSAPF